MQIENEFDVAAPVDQVWQYMLDVPRMAPCLPGAELTQDLGNGAYKGQVTTKMGPLSLRFAGEAKILEQDEAAKRIVIDASGSEQKGQGQANMKATTTMHSAGSGTRVKVNQDLQLSGAAAQYGSKGMIQDVASQLMRSFGDCLQDNIGRARRGEAIRSAGEMKGFTVGLQAMLAAIKRFFRQLFGGGKK